MDVSVPAGVWFNSLCYVIPGEHLLTQCRVDDTIGMCLCIFEEYLQWHSEDLCGDGPR